MKTLQTTLLVVFILLGLTTTQAQWGNQKVKGNGNVTTITRSTSDYDSLRLSGWMDFEIVEGTEGKITIEGESNLLDYIITEVEYNGLVIKIENGVNLSPSRNKTIKITIPIQSINEVALAGSGDVKSNTTITTDNFESKVSGSGNINLDVDANKVDVTVTGSGDITLTGNTKNLEVTVTGSGDFDGERLNADYTEAKVTGSGDIVVIANKEIEARVTGSGDIKYKGNPEKVNKKVTGSGDISN